MSGILWDVNWDRDNPIKREIRTLRLTLADTEAEEEARIRRIGQLAACDYLCKHAADEVRASRARCRRRQRIIRFIDETAPGGAAGLIVGAALTDSPLGAVICMAVGAVVAAVWPRPRRQRR